MAPAELGGGLMCPRPERDDSTVPDPPGPAPGASGVVARLPEPGGSARPLGTDDLLDGELADALWLSRHLDPSADRAPPAPATPPGDTPPTGPCPPAPTAPPEHAPEPQVREPDPLPNGIDLTPPPTPAGGVGATLAAPAGRADVPPDQLVSGRPVGWLAGPAALAPLPDPRKLARSLRPLARTMLVRRTLELDDEATAVDAAETGLWLPRWRPARARTFDAVVVADDGASMAIWQHTVADFRLLLERQGAFRDVRLVRLDTSRTTARGVTISGESVEASGPTVGRSPAELLDPTGRRIIFVLTDGVGAAWRSGALAGWLRRWAAAGPVVLVNTLPQELWHWGNLATRRVSLHATDTAVANRELRYRLLEPAGPLDPPPDVGADAVPIPVLELHPQWLGRWARLVTATGPVSVELPALLVEPPVEVRPPVPDEQDDRAAPAERVLRFRTVASTAAFRLAGLLAAVPLNLSVMRLVQAHMLPQSRMSDLAQVFLSGLLTRIDERPVGADPYAVEFEFVDGVRAELLATGIRAETARVLRLVSDYLGSRVAAMRNVRTALVAPDRAEDPEVSAKSLPFVRVQQAALAALAGPYSLRAIRLGATIDQSSESFGATRIPVTSDMVDGLSPTSSPATSAVLVGGDVTTVDLTRESAPARATAELPTVWGGVPPRSVNFTGRDELLSILRDRLVRDSTAAVLPEALHGMGGVGKTLLAVEYVYRHAADYDLVWWIPAQETTQIQASFVALASRLGLVSDGAGAQQAVPAALEALRIGRPAVRWLLVFDNAERPSDIRPLIPAGPGHVLITSRNSQWSSIARGVEVDIFTREESRRLLQRKCPGMSDHDADRIAEALGDLPLAVSQAGAWCAETGMPAAEYLELFDDKRQELLRDRPVDYPVAVAAAWNISLDRLAKHHPAAFQLVRVCAFFGSEPIARSIFSYIRDDSVPRELAEALGDPVKLGRAMRAISRYGLARIDLNRDTVQFHRLVQAAVQDQLTDDERDTIGHIAHRLLLNAMPALPGNVKNWTTSGQLLPHVRASRAADCHDQQVRRMVVYLLAYLISWGDPATAAELAGGLVRKWTERFGEAHEDTLAAGRQLGIALRLLGRYREAREVHQHTYDLLRQTMGEDHEDTLAVGNLLARDLRAVGEFGQARSINAEIYRRSLVVMGQTDPLTLASAGFLAASLRLLGEFVHARLLDDGSAGRLAEVYGPDDSFVLAARNNLGIDLRELGRYLDSRDLLEDTVARYRKLFGDEHPATLGAMKNLAVARRKAGDHTGALQLAIDARDGLRRRYGDEHPEVLAAAMNLSIDLRATGDLRSARALGVSTRQRYLTALGDRHPFTVVGTANLAVTLRLLSDVDGARLLSEEALHRFRDDLGEDHPFALVAAANLASDQHAAGDAQGAFELDTDTLVRAGDRLGADHPTTLAIRLNLSIDLRGLDRTDEADEIQRDVVTRLGQAIGPDHPGTAAAQRGDRADCDIEPLPF